MLLVVLFVAFKFPLISYSNEKYVIVRFKCVTKLCFCIPKLKTITEEIFDGEQNNSVYA